MMTDVTFRQATEADLPFIVSLLADDVFGQARNPKFETVADTYRAAFRAIEADANNSLHVAVFKDRIAGCYQLTVIPGLSHAGSVRAQIEGVRIAGDVRGRGLGEAMMQNAIALARARGCNLLQLTTDLRRERAHRFYERLGFKASHHGMKLWL
jgi:ribosomal protein S18 acetylase RimI-like enzyme